MMDNVCVVKAESGQEIEAVLRSCRNDFFNQSLNNDETIAELCRKFAKFACVLVVCEGKSIAGFVAFYVNGETKTAYISMIVIQKTYQGRGFGSVLLEQMIAECKRAGQQRIRLEVANQNEKAIGFYKKWGFAWEGQASETSDYYSLALE